jgi:hypothetical protein
MLVVAGCSGVAGPTCDAGAGAGACTRVLFLGNSYTYVNDLPSTFAQLARSAGRNVEASMVANGGETLAQHAASPESLDKIASQAWTYEVLQDQSETPATSAGRDYYTYPAARTLANRVEAAGAVPMFFMTWAHRDGLPQVGLPGYESMQQQLDGAYFSIAHELRVPVAPVGYTWYMVRHDHMYIEATKVTSMTNGWPSDWIDRVPPPDGCTLAAKLIASMPTGFNAACTYPDNDPVHRQQVVAAYKAKLQAAGFTLDTSGDSSGMPPEEAPVSLVKGSIKVNIIPNGAPDGMSISASQGD